MAAFELEELAQSDHAAADGPFLEFINVPVKGLGLANERLFFGTGPRMRSMFQQGAMVSGIGDPGVSFVDDSGV